MNKADVWQKNLLLRTCFLVILGLASGVINGLLGAGGGILTIYAIGYALKNDDPDKKDIYANALCVMLPVSAVSCIRYASMGALPAEGFALYAVCAIAGGAVGGFLLSRLKASFTKKLFSAIVIWSGILLIIK